MEKSGGEIENVNERRIEETWGELRRSEEKWWGPRKVAFCETWNKKAVPAETRGLAAGTNTADDGKHKTSQHENSLEEETVVEETGEHVIAEHENTLEKQKEEKLEKYEE